MTPSDRAPSEAAPSEPLIAGHIFQPGATGDDAVQRMLMILDAQDDLTAIRRLRDWGLEAADVRPGERVADVGSGTGTMTRRLGDLVSPGGTAVGVEPNSVLRTVAAARAAGHAGDRGVATSYVDGLAGSLPFGDSSLDLVWCERVLQHVSDPQAALTEIARVLAPGGRAVVLDSDHATRVASAVDDEVAAALLRSFLDHAPNGRAARDVPRQAITAGLTVDPDVGSAALVFPRQLLLTSPLLSESVALAVAEGAITAEQGERAVADQRAAAEAGWAFASVTMFGFVLRKR